MHNQTFADIGMRSIAARRGLLEEIRPPQLPRRFLPAGKSNPRATFTPSPGIHTAEELAAELARQRRRYAPFLRDLAPDLPGKRIVRRLDQFQWRLHTDPEWKVVTVPHFGGPIGRAAALYRTAFTVSREMLDKGAVFVRFNGVDYRAHVFVNDVYVGSHEGFFAPFEFECTALVHEGDNVLLVRVENDAIYMGNAAWGSPEEGDKLYGATNLGWDDPDMGWNHCPPGFGIYQEVFVEARAPLHIVDVFVRPLPDEQRAEAWIEVWNTFRENIPAAIEISVFGQNFRQTIFRRLRHTPRARIVPGLGDLQKPTDNQEVTLTMGAGANLIKVAFPIPKPRRWELETPWLYQIQVALLDGDGQVVDTAKRQFGMRTFRQDTQSVPRGRLFLNNREIRLRGANTMGFEQQDVFRRDLPQLIDDILLAKICHMNFLRLTQRPVQPEVYEYCDRLGLMTQTDLPLFGCLRFNKFAEAIRQAEEMERLIRAHPCNVLVSYINEPFPNASGKPHRHLTRADLQAFFEAADRAVRVLNPDRVTKHVDGDYDPPGDTLPDNHCYCGWYNGHGLELGKLHRGYWVSVRPGWHYGCGEFGAEGLDPADLMRRRYPQHWLSGAEKQHPHGAVGTARDNTWSPGAIHGAQTGDFHYLWFDTQHTLDDWVRVSQQHQAWVTRLFAERFRRDNRMVSFAIHLFIDAFPAGWMKAIMDCERRPKPAYFAYRDALQPLTVSIRTDRWKFFAGERLPFEVWVCNDTLAAPNNLRLRWQIEQNGKVIFAQQTRARVERMRATFQGFFAPRAPQVKERMTFTLRAALGTAETAVEYEVFPAMPSTRRSPNVILMKHYAEYRRRRAAIDRAVHEGARALFLELPAGEYDIGGSHVTVVECVMRPRQFVSRATGHPLVAGFESEDLKCWYDPKAGYFRPLLSTMFDAEGWVPILTNGNGVWGGKSWTPMLAAAEKSAGKGSYVICQIELTGRTRHNPPAAIFARRLFAGNWTVNEPVSAGRLSQEAAPSMRVTAHTTAR